MRQREHEGGASQETNRRPHERPGREEQWPLEPLDVQPEHDAHAERDADVGEERHEEEDGGYRALAGERAARGLGQNWQRVQHAGAFASQAFAERVPDEHVSGPPAEKQQNEQDGSAGPCERPRPPAAALREHPQRVDERRHHRGVARVPMQSSYPVADPEVCGEARDRFPGCGNSIEQDQPQPGCHDRHVQRHGDRSALIERIEPPPIEAIPGRVDRGQQPKRQTFDRPQHR